MIRNVGGGWRLREFKMEEGKKKEKKKKDGRRSNQVACLQSGLTNHLAHSYQSGR